MSRATRRARSCGSGSRRSGSSRTPWSKSPSAVKASDCSNSTGWHARTRYRRARAATTAAFHRAVFPAPASPSRVKTDGRARMSSRNRSMVLSSAARPKTVSEIAVTLRRAWMLPDGSSPSPAPQAENPDQEDPGVNRSARSVPDAVSCPRYRGVVRPFKPRGSRRPASLRTAKDCGFP